LPRKMPRTLPRVPPSEPCSSVPRWPQADSVNCCSKCFDPIHGSADSVTAQGSSYHSKCFTCDVCSTAISGTYFLDKAHGLRCQCCHERGAPNCARCGKKVIDKSVATDEGTYHRECFTCGLCRRPIEGQYRSSQDHGIICCSCHKSNAPCCAACGKKVIDKSISANGKTYHEQCFKCCECHKHISGSFFLDDGKKKGSSKGLLCEHCHEVKHPPTFCSACHGCIDGVSVGVGADTFHKECFKCCRCARAIDGRYLKADDGYLCSACQPRCVGCKESLSGRTTVQVKGKDYHTECFKCCTCGLAIKGSHYEADWGLHRCTACHAASLQAEEDAKDFQKETLERRLIKRNSKEFNLCWRAELEPCSLRALEAMGLRRAQLPRGKFVGLCFDKKTGRVGCATLGPQCDSSSAVNMSYLASALQVLKRHGREPCFSLDSKDPHNLAGDTLVKRFHPSWLASTVFGEVLFQADYALKEICFGQHAEALPWLHNVFDEIGERSRNGAEPHAVRQWFTVRKAMVIVTADGAVVPKVEMGVETRRLAMGKNGYEDAPYTSPDDPMVKQAALVSKHFNKVAGHLPVVGELFALARAMVAAKFLLEHGCRCNNSVLEKYSAPQTPEGPRYPMEIPTLAKERGSTKVVHKDDGKGLVLMRRQRAMHGGVDLSVPTEKVPAKCDSVRLLAPNEKPTLLPFFIQPSAAAAA